MVAASVVDVASSVVVVASSVVVVALLVVVVAASVVSADVLSLLHAAVAPTRTSRPRMVLKRRPSACREGSREGCSGVFDRGEYMMATTSKDWGT